MIRFSEKGLSIIKAISIISGGFTFLVALTMLFSLIQLKILKPLDNPVLINIKEQFDKDPENQDIKEQVRALDLMARKAYFSSRWQVETGSYLLLAGAIIFVLCHRILSDSSKRIPQKPGEPHDLIKESDRRRKYILTSAAFISVAAVIASILLRNNLPDPLPVPVAGTIADIGNTQTIVNNAQEVNPEPVTPVVGSISPVVSPEIVQKTEPVERKAGTVLPGEITSDKSIANTSFPFFRGNGGRGIADGTGFPTKWNGKEGKNIRWKAKIPRKGYNSPIIWDNRLFISGADEQGAEIYCFDKNTGKLLWTANVSDIPGAPSTVPETTDDTGLSAPTLATDGSFVCAIFATGNLFCFDMNGKRIWFKSLGIPKNHYGHSSSLIIYNGTLLVQYDRNDKSTLYGFNITSGDLKWETARQVKISWASPVITQFNGIPQVILSSDPYAAAYDPVTGKELWRIKTISAEIGPSPAVNDKMVFVANEFARLVAIKVGVQPEIAWEDNQYLPEVSSPVANNEMLFVATTYGAVACYNAETGELFWSHEFDNGFYSSPIINGDNVYLLDITGVMHIFKASKVYSPVSEPALGEKTVCTPAFSERKIYIRGNENLYCIEGE